MNKTALKNFAIAARLELLQRVMNRANLYGVNEETCKAGSIAPSSGFQKLGGELLTREEENQRDALIRRVNQQGYRQTMEEAAYTWFNRLIALRYMQEHQLLPVSQRVLPVIPGQMPEIIREAHQLSLDGVDSALVLDLLDRNETTSLYRYLLIGLCNALHDPLPMMFEKISDYTELLFPDGLLKDDSVLAALAKIPAVDFQDIQVIGWLYQYYISEKHDEVVNINGSSVKKEDVPAATCLYTTDWVVKYMVQNSLGRLWLEGHPEESLRMKWRYYMDEAQQEPEVAAKLADIRQGYASMQLEDIKLLDPCMGSGHILVYAFDMLMEIYRTMGYTDRDAVRSIVENNLYGLDIDDRAAQLAYFAIMMKASEYDRRFLRRGIQPHVCAMQESYGMPEAAWEYFDGQKNMAQALYRAFEHAKDFGSLIAPDATPTDLTLLESQMEEMARHAEYADLATQATIATALSAMQPLMEQARILVNKYDVVMTNPPYLNKFNPLLKGFVQDNYPDSKSDLFSVFMARNFEFCKENGYSAFMTPFVWMFIKSYERLREYIIKQKSITTLIQMEYSAFEEATVPICTFVLRNSKLNYKGNYLRLSDFKGGMAVQDEKVLEAQETPGCKYRYTAQQENFRKIPGMPVAYWVSEAVRKVYLCGKALSEIAAPRKGNSTSDNNRFLRLWHEIDIASIQFNGKEINRSHTKVQRWIPYNKGGGYRKWYGYREYVVDWYDDASEIRKIKTAVIANYQYFMKPGLTWSTVTSGKFSIRHFGDGFIFDNGGCCIFELGNKKNYLNGLLNSRVFEYIFEQLNPTINYQSGEVAKFPVIFTSNAMINDLVNAAVQISQDDYDSIETSWDFKKHPLI